MEMHAGSVLGKIAFGKNTSSGIELVVMIDTIDDTPTMEEYVVTITVKPNTQMYYMMANESWRHFGGYKKNSHSTKTVH